MSGRMRAGDVLDQYTARQRARQTESTGKATDKELLAAVNRLITVTQQSAATTGRAVGREWRGSLDRASRSSLCAASGKPWANPPRCRRRWS